MKKDIPSWAMKTALPEDQNLARDSHRRGRMQIKWPDLKALRGWARRQGWPTPWFGFNEAFIAKILENRENFELAINKSGIVIHIPRQGYRISVEEISKLDALYEERSATGRPVSWDILVEELREIRRAVEAGVVITIEGTPAIRTWQDFYSWAHGRYHALEDGCDHWIGDDDS